MEPIINSMTLPKPAPDATPAQPIYYDFLDPNLHRAQRTIIAILMTLYLTLSNTLIPPLNILPILWFFSALYLSMQLISPWVYSRVSAHHTLFTQLYVILDLLFAGYCYLIDGSNSQLGLLYVFILTLTNSCQHGREMFEKVSLQAAIVVILITPLHFSLLRTLPSITWVILAILYIVGISAVKLLYVQLQEANLHALKNQEIDPLTGMAHSDAFLKAIHLALNIKGESFDRKVFMLLEVKSLNDKKLGQKSYMRQEREAIKYLARLLHIHSKIDDLICRIEHNTFAILLNGSEEKDADELGMTLQHDFARWSEYYDLTFTLSIAATAVPLFSVSFEVLFQHTQAGLNQPKEVNLPLSVHITSDIKMT